MFKEPSGPDHGVRNPEGFDAEGRLDHHWVTRWLDDVGLPQYKVTVSMVSAIDNQGTAFSFGPFSYRIHELSM